MLVTLIIAIVFLWQGHEIFHRLMYMILNRYFEMTIPPVILARSVELYPLNAIMAVITLQQFPGVIAIPPGSAIQIRRRPEIMD